MFFFGGLLIGFFTMTMLAKVFGVTTHIGGDIDLPGALLIAVSLLIGFGISYSIVHFAEVIKERRTEDKR